MSGICRITAQMRQKLLQGLYERIFVAAIKVRSVVALSEKRIARKNDVIVEEEANGASRMSGRQKHGERKIAEIQNIAVLKGLGRRIAKHTFSK